MNVSGYHELNKISQPQKGKINICHLWFLDDTFACVFTCTHVYVCAFVGESLSQHTCGVQMTASVIDGTLPPCLRRCISLPVLYCRDQAGMTMNFQGFSCLSRSNAGITDSCYHILLVMGSGTLNSSPHTWMAGALPTRPAFQTSVTFNT